MAVTATCPFCYLSQAVEEQQIGTEVPCQGCGRRFAASGRGGVPGMPMYPPPTAGAAAPSAFPQAVLPPAAYGPVAPPPLPAPYSYPPYSGAPYDGAPSYGPGAWAPPPFPPGAAGPKRSRGTAWTVLWTVLGVIVAVTLSAALPVLRHRATPVPSRVPSRTPSRALSGAVSGGDLARARAGFSTKLLRSGPAPQSYQAASPPPGVRQITYPSGNLRLKAWLSDDPADGQRHPAVVFLHGGFSFGRDDWDEQAAYYARAGYVVMTPMLRGENGNPGRFELWYGEVDDAVAAGRYVAALPYVDPNRVFVAGHSVGGTLTMLAAEVDSPFKAAAAFSGSPDRFDWIKMGGSRWCPFNPSDNEELRLRSPLHFVASLRIPLYVYYGSQEAWCRGEVRSFEAEARRQGKAVYVTQTPGDHMTSVPAGIADSIVRFQAMP